MPLTRTTVRPAAAALAVLLGATFVCAPVREARADEVSPKGKGIVGGALIGAEVVTITEGLAGARPAWAYIVGGVLGGAAGGIGGHFIDNASSSSDGKLPMYLLAIGLGGVIPAIVISLNATRFQPDEGATEDSVPTGPAAEPGAVGGSVVSTPATAPNVAPPPQPDSPPPATPALPPPAPAPPGPTPPPQSLLDIQRGLLRLGVPVPEMRSVYTVAEQRQYGLLHAETEVRMPMLSMTF
jgi:hypothetical protein